MNQPPLELALYKNLEYEFKICTCIRVPLILRSNSLYLILLLINYE